MSTLSTLANAGPARYPMTPTGRSAFTCRARMASGRGKRVKSPSLIIAWAPITLSSAG